MADCFISHSTRDKQLAEYVRRLLTESGVTVFVAPFSLKPGDAWSPKTRTELRASSCVIFLAGRDACHSAYVQQELGMAMALAKRLIPVVWDIDPSELPGWAKEVQAIDLRGKTAQHLQGHLAQLAQTINQDRAKGALILAALALAVICLTGD